MAYVFKRRRTVYLRLSSKMSKIGQVVAEIWAKKWSKAGKRDFFEKQTSKIGGIFD